MPQPGRSEIESRLSIRKCTDDAGASPNLAQDALEGVIGTNTPPVLLREGVVGQRLLDCRFHDLGGLNQA